MMAALVHDVICVICGMCHLFSEDYIRRENSGKISKRFRYLP